MDPCSPVDIDTALQLEVAADGIPIIFYNSCPDEEYLEEDKYVFVGSNETDAGQYQGEYILEQFSGKDTINVAIFEGQKLHSATLGRTSALKAALRASGKTINYVFDDYADWDTELAKQQFEIILKTGQEIDVVASNNDSMALGVIQACEEKGISFDDIKIIGIDATADGCKAIEVVRWHLLCISQQLARGAIWLRQQHALPRESHWMDWNILRKTKCMSGFHLKR